jgi:murein DD-endopeptidase MepM/ murein hydrolase activator NlpD
MMTYILAVILCAPPTGDQTAASSAAHADVPRPTLRQELLTRVAKDQKARQALVAMMQKQGSADPTDLADPDHPVLQELADTDADNTQWLKQVVSDAGWPVASQVGKDGAHAAWLLLQHADRDPAFQKQCLALMRAADPGEVDGQDIAYLADRVSIKETGKQLYGTQLQWVDGVWKPRPLKKPEQVDQLRSECGLPPLADYVQMVTDMMSGSQPTSEDNDAIQPLLRTVDMNVGDQSDVTLCNGKTVRVELKALTEQRDLIRAAVRKAVVTITVDGQEVEIPSATYHLPVTAGPAQVDCPITKGHVQPGSNPWALDKEVRLRFWPADSPWITPGTFTYPVNQRWFASHTLMANEIGDDERPDDTTIYYHWGLDFGGAEKMVQVLAATDGKVVSAGDEVLAGHDLPDTVKPRYDVVYLLDRRGWYYRYSHLDSIVASVKPGALVAMGQQIGVLGKEGASGGWSHLHFDIALPQPSGRYGITDGYAFVWQAYRTQYDWPLQAVARPHQLAWVNEPVVLDGSKSTAAGGSDGLKFQWQFSDGTVAHGAKVRRRFQQSGTYSEILQVTDSDGNVDYDFASVQVLDRANPNQQPPTLHAAYWPTFGIKAHDQVTFKVRSFRIDGSDGHETWEFGDGSPPVNVQSDGNVEAHAPNGYAVTTHAFAQPGHYIVTVQRTNHRGQTGAARLQVRVE